MSKRALRIMKNLAKPGAVLSAIVISGASVASAADLQKVTVRMDWVVSAYHAPFYAGVKNGFFKDQGLMSPFSRVTAPPMSHKRSAMEMENSPRSMAGR